MPTSFNVWVPQGNIVANPGGLAIGNPSVIPGLTGVVLSGTVFGMWAGYDASGDIYYFESADGLTSWTAYSGNPMFGGGSPIYFPTVYEESGTFYAYGCTSAFPGTGIAVYTAASPIGPWTSQGIQIAPGTAGAWDSGGTFQLNIVDIIAGTWYGYYSGYNGVKFGEGLATSTDGIHWTKSGSNPIFAGPIGNLGFLKVSNSSYYAYGNFPSPNAVLQANQNNPVGRWAAGSPSGPWTQLMSNSVEVPVYYISTPAEINNASGLPIANANDLRYVVANGNIYLYYTYTQTSGAEIRVDAALASGFTPAQLTATYEGVFNVPFTGLPSLNLNTLASDPGTGANANPIAGNWSPRVAGDTAQRLSNVINASAVATPADSYWNALTWNADQWSQITINNETNGSFLGPAVRISTGGVATAYRLIVEGGTGSGASLAVQSQVTGTSTNLATLPFTISVGDTIMAVVIGTNLLVYWNGYLIYNASTSSIASGAAGFELQGTTLVTNSGISAWSGGNFQSTPAISYSISGNAGIAGATISYSGTSSGSVTADGSGNYTISGLANGSYTLTPSLAGYTFSPPSQVETLAGSNITGANFTANKNVTSGGDMGFNFDYSFG